MLNDLNSMCEKENEIVSTNDSGEQQQQPSPSLSSSASNHAIKSDDKSTRYVLGSIFELLEQIISEKLNNAVALLENSRLSFSNESESCLESFMAQHLIQKFGLKRILIVNMDKNHNLTLQRKFYHTSK